LQVYIRTYSNEKTTVLTAASYKTEESVRDDNILTQFHGIISQDHETKFYKYGDKHATCGAHLTRELRGLAELELLPWGNEVREFFIKMNKQKNEDVRMGKRSCGHDLLCNFENKYDELLRKGKRILEEMKKDTFGYNELRRMVNILENNKDNYMLFIRDYDAPFTNNEAERDLRHCKTKQKVSGCYRSWQGIIDYCKIRSVLSTAIKRGEDLFDTILLLLEKNQLPAGQ
ncbi:MAG: transposase, partial [Firmicutes bacterium]|nr:transposase [Bacillota bacterium]